MSTSYKAIMAKIFINREFYDAIIHFDEDEKAQEYFYKVMDSHAGEPNEDGSI